MAASVVFLVASCLLSLESVKYTRRSMFTGKEMSIFWILLNIYSFLNIGILLMLYFAGTLLGLFSFTAILFNPFIIVGSIALASATGGFTATKIVLRRRNELELSGM